MSTSRASTKSWSRTSRGALAIIAPGAARRRRLGLRLDGITFRDRAWLAVRGQMSAPEVFVNTEVLRGTGDIRKVSLWLGHASQMATEAYLEPDPAEKLEALGAPMPPLLRKRVRPSG